MLFPHLPSRSGSKPAPSHAGGEWGEREHLAGDGARLQSLEKEEGDVEQLPGTRQRLGKGCVPEHTCGIALWVPPERQIDPIPATQGGAAPLGRDARARQGLRTGAEGHRAAPGGSAGNQRGLCGPAAATHVGSASPGTLWDTAGSSPRAEPSPKRAPGSGEQLDRVPWAWAAAVGCELGGLEQGWGRDQDPGRKKRTKERTLSCSCPFPCRKWGDVHGVGPTRGSCVPAAVPCSVPLAGCSHPADPDQLFSLYPNPFPSPWGIWVGMGKSGWEWAIFVPLLKLLQCRATLHIPSEFRVGIPVPLHAGVAGIHPRLLWDCPAAGILPALPFFWGSEAPH